MTTATPEKTDGLKALLVAIEAIEKSIKEMGGVFEIQMAVSSKYCVILLVLYIFLEDN